jgi:hypothetical protein
MKVTITDKLIKHVLSLTPEEEVFLLRYKKLGNRRGGGGTVQVESPILVVCDNQRFQVDILEIEEVGNRYDEYGQEPERIKKAEDIGKLDPFDMTLELTPELFKEVVATREPLILFRVLNIPAYIRTNKIKIIYDKSKDVRQEPNDPAARKPVIPTMVVRVEKIRPVDDLLKQHITDSAFYEVFIQGKREEFYDVTGAELDDLVGIIGVRRRVEEGDVELRKRVIEYIKMRVASLSTIKDSEMTQLVRTAEEEADVQKKLDDAAKKKRKERK